MRLIPVQNIHDISRDLKAGKTVVFPTETSYGLGCDATNQQAVDKIFFIKGRPSDKPLLIVVSDVESAKRYLVWSDTLQKLAVRYWPGPLTIIGKYKESAPGLAKGVVGRDGTVAVRVSNFPFLKKITVESGLPIVATSANVSTEADQYDHKALLEIFSERDNRPDLVVEGGKLPETRPTTVVSIVSGAAEVVRQGELKIEL